MFHRYVFYEESKLGNYLSIVDNKNQRVLINQRKSSIFNPQNIGNPEKYRMQCQQDMYIIDFFDKHIGIFPKYIPICLSKKIDYTHLLLALHFLLFWITNIPWGKCRVFATVYQNSLVFMIDTGQRVAEVPLLIKNIPVKHQRLTSMFNIRY